MQQDSKKEGREGRGGEEKEGERREWEGRRGDGRGEERRGGKRKKEQRKKQRKLFRLAALPHAAGHINYPAFGQNCFILRTQKAVLTVVRLYE
jgi:hypothetical protein